MASSSATPLTCGLSLAVTTAILYIACAVVVAVWPGAMVAALGTIVHGLNVSGAAPSMDALSWSAVAVGTCVAAAYAFVAGLLFGFVHRWFAR